MGLTVYKRQKVNKMKITHCSTCIHFSAVQDTYIKRKFYGDILLVDKESKAQVIENFTKDTPIRDNSILIIEDEVSSGIDGHVLKNCLHDSVYDPLGTRISGLEKNNNRDCKYYNGGFWAKSWRYLGRLFT